MTAIKSQHSRVFEQLVAERKAQLIDSLVTGAPADFPAYRQIVGQLLGLTEALALSEEADYKLSGEEPSASS